MSSEIARLRAEIDALDRRIVALLNRRLALVDRIAPLKRRKGLKPYSASRTAEILRHVTATNAGPLSARQLRKIYRQIIMTAVERQEKSARRKS